MGGQTVLISPPNSINLTSQPGPSTLIGVNPANMSTNLPLIQTLTQLIQFPLPTNSGGTGLNIPVGSVGAGQLLVGSGGGFALANLTPGSNITISNLNGGIVISATGLEPLITIPIPTNSGGTGLNTPIGSVTNGQLLIGNSGGYSLGNITSGNSNLTVTNNAGNINLTTTGLQQSITIPITTNSGGTGLNIPTGSVGAGQLLTGSGGGFSLSTLNQGNNILITNQNGTITIAATGLQPSINIPIATNSGGTGLNVPVGSVGAGQLLVGSGGGFALANLLPGSNISITNNNGAITVATTGLQAPITIPITTNSGGTGLNIPVGSVTAGQLLVGSGGGFTLSTLQAGTNVSITNQNGTVTISATGLEPLITIPITTNSGGTGLNTPIGSVPNGNILIGSGGGYNVGPIIGGTNISVTNGPGTILINDTATASSYINFPLATNSGGTGLNIPIGSVTAGQLLVGSGGGFALSNLQPGNNVTVNNQQGTITIGTTGLQPTIGIPLAINSGGTGLSTVVGSVPNGALLIGSGGGWNVGQLAAGSNMSISSGAGTLSIASTVVYPLGVTSGGTGIGTIPTSGQLLIGSGGGYSLSTLNPGTNVTVTSTDGTVTVNAPNAAAFGPSGQVQYSSGGTGSFGSSPNFFWNATNNRLGIKNNNPSGGLDISGPVSGGPSAIGPYLGLSSSTYTDNVTASGGTGATIAFNTIGIPVATTTSGSVTQTSNVTLTIGGSPQLSGTNNTVGNSIGVLISSGSGSVSAAGNTTSNSFSLVVYPQSGANNNYNTVFVAGNVGIQKNQPRSGVEFGNSIAVNRVSVADTNYTVLSSDYIVAYTTLTAARTVTLVSAANINSRIYIIKDEAGTASTNNITVQGSTGTQKIDGATTSVINTNYGMLEIYAFSSNWYILNKR